MFLHPGHQGSQPGPNLFNGMPFALLQQRVVAFVAGLVFLDPAFGEPAGLNILQRPLHPLLHAGVNDLRPDRHVADDYGDDMRNGRQHRPRTGRRQGPEDPCQPRNG